MASKNISLEQSGFIQGRKIEECIGITSEMFNMLHSKTFGGNMALKIDVRKAFDTLDRDFLLKVLQSFGFNSKLYQWIHTILNSAKLSFLVNENPVGFFNCKRCSSRQSSFSSLVLFSGGCAKSGH